MKYLIIFVFILTTTYSRASESDTLDWLLIYYMPYDNDLSEFSTEIVSSIVKGSEGCTNVGITIQADLSDTLGHKRYVITDGKIDTTLLSVESSDISVFKDYLNWVNEKFVFDRCALFFLDHGADLGSMGIDTYPAMQVYNIVEVSNVIEAFNSSREQQSDLLFLQQCNRSSIEILYEFRDCAEYTLASQLNLGAPNSYYVEMIQMLGKNPNLSSEELGTTIAQFDGEDMYYSYTLVDNSTLDNYVFELSTLINQLSKVKCDPDVLITEEYFGETYWDIHSMINVASFDQAILKELQYLPGSKTIRHLTNPKSDKVFDYCGVSIYSPFNKQLKSHAALAIFDVIDYKWLKKNFKALKPR